MQRFEERYRRLAVPFLWQCLFPGGSYPKSAPGRVTPRFGKLAALTESWLSLLSGAPVKCPPTALGSPRLNAGRLCIPPHTSESACGPFKSKFKCNSRKELRT
jgi:hypothetical protein